MMRVWAFVHGRRLLAIGVASASLATAFAVGQLQSCTEPPIRGGVRSESGKESDPGSGMVSRPTPENAAEIARAVAQRAALLAQQAQIREDRIEHLRHAVAAAFEAMFGQPDAIVRHQREFGATLNGAMLRAWLAQMHEWGAMTTVPAEESDDLELFMRAVRALDDRYAAIESVDVESMLVGVRLDLDYNTEAWPFDAHRAQASMWTPVGGPLTFTEGEAIKDGAAGRTLHVTLPVRFVHGGSGRLRINFYWDEAGEYWVPHMAIMAAEDRRGRWPLLLL